MGVSAAQKFGQGSYGHGIPPPGLKKILLFSVSMTFYARYSLFQCNRRCTGKRETVFPVILSGNVTYNKII
jgi:hypothetical protein